MKNPASARHRRAIYKSLTAQARRNGGIVTWPAAPPPALAVPTASPNRQEEDGKDGGEDEGESEGQEQGQGQASWMTWPDGLISAGADHGSEEVEL